MLFRSQPAGRLEAELPGTVHLDLLDENGKERFAVLINRADQDQRVRIQVRGRWQGLYTGLTLEAGDRAETHLPAHFEDIFRIIPPDHQG